MTESDSKLSCKYCNQYRHKTALWLFSLGVRCLVNQVAAERQLGRLGSVFKRQGMATVTKDDRLTSSQSFLCVGFAGIFSKTVTSPLEVVKILSQVGTFHCKYGFMRSFQLIYQHEGLRAFWKGNCVSCFRLFPYSAIHLGTYKTWVYLFYFFALIIFITVALRYMCWVLIANWRVLCCYRGIRKEVFCLCLHCKLSLNHCRDIIYQ